MTNVPVLARAPLRGERVGGGAGVDRVVHQGCLLIQLHRPVHEAVSLEAPHHLPGPHDRAADVWRQRGHLLQRAGIYDVIGTYLWAGLSTITGHSRIFEYEIMSDDIRVLKHDRILRRASPVQLVTYLYLQKCSVIRSKKM